MKRRGFLGLFGGAAVSGPRALAQLADPVLRQAGFPMGDGIVAAAPSAPEIASAGAMSRALRWIRKNGIPAWKMNDIRRKANHERAFGLDPDIAALRSVSPGWKAITQRRRNIDRVTEESLDGFARHSAQRRFAEKMRDRFGVDEFWYD